MDAEVHHLLFPEMQSAQQEVPVQLTQTRGSYSQLEHSWLTALVLFLFLAGVLPASALAIVLVSLWLLGIACRILSLQQYAQHMRAPAQGQTPAFLETIQATLSMARTPVGATFLLTGHYIDTVNLRLSAMDRDFTGDDYDALLALDGVGLFGGRRRQSITDADLARLPQHLHASSYRADGNEGTCSVCLEDFQKGARIRALHCRHSYCGDCIEPWLRQQGKGASCPLCKQPAFPPVTEV